ncbi:MAG: hypothetical protein RBT47_07645 [Anaerolineae bacterium]|jgi:hypothetical protein|nr:hypothetical protein [Anaerolineae bacterium]
MKLIGKLIPKADTEFAIGLAKKIILQYPPSSEPKLARKGSQKRLEGILASVMQEIAVFQSTHRLGWFRKARFANTFRWQLKDAGYSEGFTEALTEGVVKHITLTK